MRTVDQSLAAVMTRAVAACLLASCAAGCGAARGPRQITPDGAAALESQWSRVIELVPGASIEVTRRGGAPAHRQFVWAGDSSMTALNVSSAALPSSVVRVLRDLAAERPRDLAQMPPAQTFERDNVRVGRDGVFLLDRKVADLSQVLETISRTDVAEIRGPVVARGSVAGAVLGGWLGFAIGVVPGLGGVPAGSAWPIAIGSAITGGYLGSRWSSHQTEGVVYRAP